MNTKDTHQTLDAIIVGAGFSGLYQLHCLRDKLNLSVRVFETGSGIGGTWYWNRYPGARCDTESHSYCYSFDADLVREWEWTEKYPGPEEIRRYLNWVADRYDLKKDIQFDAKVIEARYDDAHQQWCVKIQEPDGTQAEYRSQFLITGVGCLSSANVPNIPGLDSFAGDWYHTGQWPHEDVDFTGKRVGQIGTGSTGIQATPVIAESAAHLTVFQRTANYSIPANNGPLTDAFKKWVKDNAPHIRRVMQASPNGHAFVNQDRSALDCSDEELTTAYEAAWQTGGLRFRTTFRDLLLDKDANDTACEFIKGKIRDIVKDPKAAAILSDIDHPYAAKRPPIDTNYFETFNQPHVDIVDLRATPIVEITADGVRTEEKEYPLDIIVFATGFDAMSGALLQMNIHGRDGVSLTEAWKEGPKNYLGLQVAGFPNLFTITGPGSPSVLCNMPVAIEQHVDWITNCIAHMREAGKQSIETTEPAMDRWVAHVNDAANATLLPQAKHSWYLGANVPGKPRVFMPYAGGLGHYRSICDDVAADGYEGFDLSA
jgi:cation diffusion facilitator CzcD-associated flavoprotein CzcO